MVTNEEKRLHEEQQQLMKKSTSVSSSASIQGGKSSYNSSSNSLNSNQQKSPLRQLASNSQVHKRNLWIKCALIEKKLVGIVEYLGENATKYYEQDALMSNYLCAQILASLLVGPCALEYSRSKTADCYQFDEPSADELIKRHKLTNPIACLCNRQSFSSNSNFINGSNNRQPVHTQLSRSITDSIGVTNENTQSTSNENGDGNKLCRLTSTQGLGVLSGATIDSNPTTSISDQQNSVLFDQDLSISTENKVRSMSPSGIVVAQQRRKPLSLKTNVKTGAIITDCHHYSCQDITEHQPIRGYSFRCLSTSNIGVQNPTGTTIHTQCNGNATTNQHLNTCGNVSCQSQDWALWSPRMLHETLHQNSRSKLLYAKNNVLLEIQPHDTVAGYLSLHQTANDLILKWIPNQMINGSQQTNSCHCNCNNDPTEENQDDESSTHYSDKLKSQTSEPNLNQDQQPIAVESSYLDLVVNMSVSRIVLLHCEFNCASVTSTRSNLSNDKESSSTTTADNIGDDEISTIKQQQESKTDEDQANRLKATANSTNPEETLILVEADGVQRAPFKFPKGGLRWFLSCLENGLAPDKYLDPAIKPPDDDCWIDPLHSPPPIDGGTIEPPATNNQDLPPTSRLDLILKRLPSLKRTRSTKPDEAQVGSPSKPRPAARLSRCTSPESNDNQQVISEGQTTCTTRKYVYRIVSIHNPDWPLQTPPHSAQIVSSSSNGSNLTQNSLSRQQSIGPSGSTVRNGQRFRWSLSRLTRFSKYTNSGSTSSSTSVTGQISGASSHLKGYLFSDDHDSSGTLELGDSQDGLLDDQTAIMGDGLNERLTANKRDNSRELARIEAKLNDLKKSTSDDLLALRTQSIQTLCESMRKQIVARAFYGWLVYCRRTKIIRQHLLTLIKDPEDSHLIKPSEDGAEIVQPILTRSLWDEIVVENSKRLTERQLRIKINQIVYYSGVESDELRREVWPYLLGHYKFKDTPSKRMERDKLARDAYKSCGHEWLKVEHVVKQRDREILAANMAKASRSLVKAKGEETGSNENQENTDETKLQADTNNNTRTTIDEQIDSPEFAEQKLPPEADSKIEEPRSEEPVDEQATEDSSECKVGLESATTRSQRIQKGREEARLAAKKRRKRSIRLESTGSVDSDASITDQFGNNVHRIDKDVQRCDRSFWYFKDTTNLEKLRNIMCTYVWQHLDVGYVQGMCDLAAPFLVIFDDEVMAFSCFSQLMKRMVANFPHGNAMDQHFESLKYLMQVLDPKLFHVLQSNGDYTHFYFCYRWLLLDFKRELAYEDVYKVWETIWSARHIITDKFVVFMALAMVRYYRDIIIENNMDFTDSIKFFNEMAERHDAEGIIALARECIMELEHLVRVV